MKQFVKDMNSKSLPGNIWIKANRGPEARRRGRALFDARQKLISAGIPDKDISSKGGRLWRIGADESATLLGSLSDDVVVWTDAAPQQVK